MKRRIISFILAFVIVMVAAPALAQDVKANVSGRATSTPVKARVDVRTDVKERRVSTSTEHREERRENIEERKATSTERRVEMQRGLAKRKAEHTARVLTATVGRLEKIIIRLESRMATIKTAGGSTLETEAFVAEAKNHLSLAKSSIALFASLDLTGEKARENFEKVRALASEIKGHIREAHRSLKMAVRALKGARVGEDHERATTTATSTSDSDE